MISDAQNGDNRRLRLRLPRPSCIKLGGRRTSSVRLDVRQRRGVRGPDYSWENSARLQQALATANISYRHIKALAPTTDLRQLQYREDDRQGVGKRNRITLAPHTPSATPAKSSTRSTSARSSLNSRIDSTTALLCVERDPEACHRSLVAARLRTEHGLPLTDLRPLLL